MSSIFRNVGYFTPYGSTKRWNITGSVEHFKQEVASLAVRAGTMLDSG